MLRLGSMLRSVREPRNWEIRRKLKGIEAPERAGSVRSRQAFSVKSWSISEKHRASIVSRSVPSARSRVSAMFASRCERYRRFSERSRARRSSATTETGHESARDREPSFQLAPPCFFLARGLAGPYASPFPLPNLPLLAPLGLPLATVQSAESTDLSSASHHCFVQWTQPSWAVVVAAAAAFSGVYGAAGGVHRLWRRWYPAGAHDRRTRNAVRRIMHVHKFHLEGEKFRRSGVASFLGPLMIARTLRATTVDLARFAACDLVICWNYSFVWFTGIDTLAFLDDSLDDCKFCG